MKLSCPDYLDISKHFSENELMIQKSTREFVDNEILPIIEEHFENGTFPQHLIEKFSEMGFLGINIPKEHSGGMNNIIYGLVCQEIERGDSGLRSFISVQNSLVMYPIFAFGDDEQKKKWLPLLASGKNVGCFGLTEPDHGSDPGNMKTMAKKVTDGYLLNGSKMWMLLFSLTFIYCVYLDTV